MDDLDFAAEDEFGGAALTDCGEVFADRYFQSAAGLIDPNGKIKIKMTERSSRAGRRHRAGTTSQSNS